MNFVIANYSMNLDELFVSVSYCNIYKIHLNIPFHTNFLSQINQNQQITYCTGAVCDYDDCTVSTIF
jgi:hypothetical protein